jgi:hypothetical protein
MVLLATIGFGMWYFQFMAVKQFKYSLTTTPVALTELVATDKKEGVTIVFSVSSLTGGEAALLGTSAITSSTFGLHLDNDSKVVLAGDFIANDVFYARAKTSACTLYVLMVGA